MLVLSRKEDQKISFPGLGITIQILRVKGASVRIGVDAPAEVRILRDELDDDTRTLEHKMALLPKHLRHELRNELNAVSIAVHLFKQEVEAGYHKEAELTFQKIVQRLEQLGENPVLSRKIAPPEPHGLSALVVEDQPNEREMLAGFLRLHGYQVMTAADGLEAIEVLKGSMPSAVLIDMRMPRLDGPTTVARIRADHKFDDVKIFAISGSTPEENDFSSGDSRINQWFMKPLNPRQLVDAMAVSFSTHN